MLDIIIASACLGLVAGLLAGLFGIGGGLVIVPVLAFVFTAHGFPSELIMMMAIATSLATIILTALSSIYTHHRLGAVLWQKVFKLSPGIIVGTAIGAFLAKQLSTDGLKLLLGVFLVYVGLQMALQFQPKQGRKALAGFWDFFAGNVIGLLSAMVGIGGGTLTVPYLLYNQLPMRNAVAISSACGLPIAIIGTLSYTWLGQNTPNLPSWSLGYIYLPAVLGISLTSIFTAPVGAWLANKLPAKQLKRYFSILLLVMAVKLLIY
ncbi:sulfite exporter TauE/SafE family protein [Methylosoma difficile]